MARERSIDEFESIFEQASIPVLEIETIALQRIGLVGRGDPLDESVLALASHLHTRFSSEILCFRPADGEADKFTRAAKSRGFTVAAEAFGSTADLVQQLIAADCRIILLCEPQGQVSRAVDLDVVVEATAPPVLVVRSPIREPSRVFSRILHSLTGNFQQTQNFAYSFTLAEEHGSVVLLHTVAESELSDVRESLRVSPEIAEKTGQDLLESLAHHGERFLKAVVAASHDRPFEVSYRIEVGEVVPTVGEALAGGAFDLLVVGAHRDGRSHVSAADYQLAHEVRNLPVLAL